MQTFKWFMGRVEDIQDPEKRNRVRVRVYGDHTTDTTMLKTDALLWADVLLPTTSSGIHGNGHSVHGLLVGSEIAGYYADGEASQQPIVTGVLSSSLYTNFVNNEQVKALLPSVAAQTALYNHVKNITQPSGTIQKPVATQYFNANDPLSLGNLTSVEAFRLKAAIGFKESSNNYGAVNQFNYVGKYQLGASALQTVKFCNSLAVNNTNLNNAASWVGVLGAVDQTNYLNLPKAQELSMDRLLETNYGYLLHFGVISHDSPAPVVAGYLAVCHLLGPGGALKLKRGQVGADANGTTATDYYNMGSKAVSNV